MGEILLTNSVPQEKVCLVQPTYVAKNVSFVVDLTSLDDHRDIRADENGVWLRKGAPVAFISIISSNPDEKPEVFRRSKMGALTNHYKVSRTYYQHSNSPDFHRIITVTYGNAISITQLCLIQWMHYLECLVGPACCTD